MLVKKDRRLCKIKKTRTRLFRHVIETIKKREEETKKSRYPCRKSIGNKEVVGLPFHSFTSFVTKRKREDERTKQEN